MFNKLALSSIVFLTLTTGVNAQIVFDESVSGDLSSDNLNPTPLSLSLGSNIITGTTLPNPDIDPDFFSFSIPAGQELSSIILEIYETTEDQSFFAVEQGLQITSIIANPPVDLLGNAVVGGADGAQLGDNVLDDLGEASFGGIGFTGALGEGTYTFWFQETVAPVEYGFNFIVSETTPEPGSIVGLGLIGLLFLRSVKNKASLRK